MVGICFKLPAVLLDGNVISESKKQDPCTWEMKSTINKVIINR